MPDDPRPGQPDAYLKSLQGVPCVDTAVRLGPLQGEPAGCVPMDVTIGKPQAFKPNRFNKDMK